MKTFPYFQLFVLFLSRFGDVESFLPRASSVGTGQRCHTGRVVFKTFLSQTRLAYRSKESFRHSDSDNGSDSDNKKTIKENTYEINTENGIYFMNEPKIFWFLLPNENAKEERCCVLGTPDPDEYAWFNGLNRDALIRVNSDLLDQETFVEIVQQEDSPRGFPAWIGTLRPPTHSIVRKPSAWE